MRLFCELRLEKGGLLTDLFLAAARLLHDLLRLDDCKVKNSPFFYCKNFPCIRLALGVWGCGYSRCVPGAGLFQVPPAWEWERKGFPPFVQRTSN